MAGRVESDILAKLDGVLRDRLAGDAQESYVASLYQNGLNKILEKVGEEATEVVLAAKDNSDGQSPEALIGEVADLWFHTMILLASQGLSSDDVLSCLGGRFGLSGHVEKAARTNT